MKAIKEEHLLHVIANNKKSFGSKFAYILELSSGFGIADIVFFRLDSKIVKSRIAKQFPPIESIDLIQILTHLNKIEDNTISIKHLKKILPSSKKQKEEIISFLIKRKFLIPKNESLSEFKIANSYKIGLKEVIAIEAKLSNWKRGFYQAYRYRQYANKSYLALHSKYVHRALANEGHFIRSNVGLIEVNDKSIKILIEPKRESSKGNIFSALVYERLLSTAKNGFPSA
jgi:hypothetical protein